MNTAVQDVAEVGQWYALRTRSRHERIVRDRLMGNGIEPFLPLMKMMRQWSDRKVWTEMPLFSGYCFARFELQSRYAVLQIPGIVDIVGGVGAGPQAISYEEMNALRTVATSDRSCDPHSYLADGSWVQVIRGPLTGLKGQLVRKASQDHIVIRVHLIQQAAAVHIQISEVQPISPVTH